MQDSAKCNAGQYMYGHISPLLYTSTAIIRQRTQLQQTPLGGFCAASALSQANAHQAGGLRGDLLGEARADECIVGLRVAGQLGGAAGGLRLRRLPVI